MSEIGWIKFGILFLVLVIAPVWLFNFFPMALKWKLTFTFGGFIGLILFKAGALTNFRSRN